MGAKAVYLIFGEDEFLVSTKAKELIEELLPEADRTMGLETIDGAVENADAAEKALAQCSEALQTMGFFVSRKVVWFKDVSFLTDNRTGSVDRVKERVDELAGFIKAGIPGGQVLLITSPKVDKRYKFYKACGAVGEIHEFAVSDKAWQNEKDTEEFLRTALQKYGLRMSRDVGTAFLEKVGTNSRQIVNEIEKLGVYLDSRKDVEMDDIKQITSFSKSAVSWDLADAFGGRDLKRALEIMRQLLFQKESTIGIIIGLNSRIRDLIIYRDAMDKGWLSGGSWRSVSPEAEEIFSGMANDPRRVHPFRLKILAKQADGFSMRELKKCQRAVMETYEKLVSSSMPDDLALELMVVRMLA